MTAEAASYRITGRPAVPRVLILFASGSPTAVLRRVWAVVVDAVYRVAGRGFSAHVGKEVLIGMQPAFANPDSPITVVHVRNGFGVIAALLHRSPSIVFRSGFIGTVKASLTMSRRFVHQWRTVSVEPSVVHSAPTMTYHGPPTVFDFTTNLRAHWTTSLRSIIP